MGSIWGEEIKNTPSFKELEGDQSCEFLIIGGGMAGILCAYFLKEKVADYLLVEGDRIGSGVTRNTTAKITAQHGLIYADLIKNAGDSKARQYLRNNLLAIQKYRELSRDIPCDFEEKAAYTFSLTEKAKIEREVKAVNSLGFKAELCKKIPLPLNVKAAVMFGNQAQFNPMKFIAGISVNLNIRERTFVTKIKGTTVYTANGKIKAKKIIIATHFPFINTKGFYFTKLYQSRSYVIALENAPDIHGMYVDSEQNGMSFRNYGNLLLIGGGDHRTGKMGGGYRELRDYKETFYPDAKEKYAWATQDCMSLDGVPYIGEYSKANTDIYVATGFNKWGMTSSMISAEILSDMITGKSTVGYEVFTPRRSFIKKQFFVNIGETLVNFVKPVTKRCTHLGCALKWNRIEHTWDCPCHGSRFDKNGKLINNPAMKDAKLKPVNDQNIK